MSYHRKSKSKVHAKRSKSSPSRKSKSRKSKSSESKARKSKSRELKSRKEKYYKKGGSLAYNLVNQAANSPPVLNDFVTSPRIRDGPNADRFAYGSKSQCGGSDAYDMVMKDLSSASNTNSFPAGFSALPKGFNVENGMKSLNLYQPSGGFRKSNKKSKRSKYSNLNKKSKKSYNSKRIAKGGSSDFMSTWYSQGPINNMSAKDYPTLFNPPNLGSAGSGAPMGTLEGASVSKTGAPII